MIICTYIVIKTKCMAGCNCRKPNIWWTEHAIQHAPLWNLNLNLVFNAIFSNISAISWQPVLVVEEAGVPGENYRPWASNWSILSLAAATTTTPCRVWCWLTYIFMPPVALVTCGRTDARKKAAVASAQNSWLLEVA